MAAEPEGAAQPSPLPLGALNVMGTPLVPCSYDPLTGFFRDGCCNTDAQDLGSHLICARVTAEFLRFSQATGNDLSTPRPEYRFAGLQARRPLVPVRPALAASLGGRRGPARGAGEHAHPGLEVCDAGAVAGGRLRGAAGRLT